MFAEVCPASNFNFARLIAQHEQLMNFQVHDATKIKQIANSFVQDWGAAGVAGRNQEVAAYATIVSRMVGAHCQHAIGAHLQNVSLKFVTNARALLLALESVKELPVDRTTELFHGIGQLTQLQERSRANPHICAQYQALRMSLHCVGCEEINRAWFFNPNFRAKLTLPPKIQLDPRDRHAVSRRRGC